MRLLYSWQASLSVQTQCIEKTVDTHKIQFPLHHIEAHRNFLRVMLNLVKPSVTPPSVLPWYSAATAQAALTILQYPNFLKMGTDRSLHVHQSRHSFANFYSTRLIFSIRTRHHAACIQTRASPDVTLYIKMSFAYRIRKLASLPHRNIWSGDYGEIFFKGKGLKFSCHHCKLEINFLFFALDIQA